jgi:NTE family protein
LILVFLALLPGNVLPANQTLQDPAPAHPRVALVLGGGGARGGAHIGVLRELEKAGVPIDLIVGTSYGALVGGLYSAGYSTEDMELIIRSIDWTRILSNAPQRKFLDFNNKTRDNRKLLDLHFKKFDLQLPIGLQAGQMVQQVLDRLTAQTVLEAENNFDKLPTAFRAVATDILKGKPHVFQRGSLSGAIRASIAIPGLFTPVEFNDTLLVDGGITNNLPVDVALASGAQVVIAVDVSTPLRTRKEQFESFVDVFDQIIGLRIEEDSQTKRKEAHVLIRPQIESVEPTDFLKSAGLVGNGASAAIAALPGITRILHARAIQLQEPRKRIPLLGSSTFDPDKFQLPKKVVVPDAVKVEGVQEYPPHFVRERVSASPGKPSSIESIDRDVSTLYATGLFEGAGYTLEKEDKTMLTYKVKENPPIKLGFGLRYDPDYDLSTMVDLIDHKFVSAGTELFFRGLMGNAKDFQLGLNRRVFGKELSLSPQVHYRSHQRLIFGNANKFGDFQDQRYGVETSLQHLLGNAGRIEVGYGWELVDIDRGSGLFYQRSPKLLGRARFQAQLDTVDDFDFPSSGSLGQIELDWYDRSLGGDFSFRRSGASVAHYLTFDSANTIGLSAAAGRIHGSAPFYELFYTGGARNLSFSSNRFPGLNRDEVVARELAVAALSFRHTVKRFKSGAARAIHVGFDYHGGWFDPIAQQQKSGRSIHGFDVAFYIDTRFFGPFRLELGSTQRGGLKAYFSIGHLLP